MKEQAERIRHNPPMGSDEARVLCELLKGRILIGDDLDGSFSNRHASGRWHLVRMPDGSFMDQHKLHQTVGWLKRHLGWAISSENFEDRNIFGSKITLTEYRL